MARYTPATTKMPPVMRRAQSSIFVRLLNAFPTDWAEKAMMKAKAMTGRAVPRPYRAGKRIFEPAPRHRGSRLPKKRAADTGQKVRAKMTPSSPAPQMPLFSIFCFSQSLMPLPLNILRLITSSRTSPTITSRGPISLFIHSCRNMETSGVDRRLEIRIAASTA